MIGHIMDSGKNEAGEIHCDFIGVTPLVDPIPPVEVCGACC